MNIFCTHDKCAKRATYGVDGGNSEVCEQHAKKGMINLRGKRESTM